MTAARALASACLLALAGAGRADAHVSSGFGARLAAVLALDGGLVHRALTLPLVRLATMGAPLTRARPQE